MLYFLIVTVPCISQETLADVDQTLNHENNRDFGKNKQDISRLKYSTTSLPNSEPGHHHGNGNNKLTSTVAPTTTTSVTENATTIITPTVITTSEPTSPTTGPTFHPITAPPDKNNTCQLLLEVYAEATSKFTECAIVHAKPFLFCENCVRQYVDANNVHKYIENVSLGFGF